MYGFQDRHPFSQKQSTWSQSPKSGSHNPHLINGPTDSSSFKSTDSSSFKSTDSSGFKSTDSSGFKSTDSSGFKSTDSSGFKSSDGVRPNRSSVKNNEPSILGRSGKKIKVPEISEESFEDAELDSASNDGNTKSQIKLIENLIIRVDKLTTVVNSVKDTGTSLISKIATLEDIISSQIIMIENLSSLNKTVSLENVPNTSLISKKSRVSSDNVLREFTPFFIKEDFGGVDDSSSLLGEHFKMTVEILGYNNQPATIYPFGNDDSLPSFKDMTLKMKFEDGSKKSGEILASFQREQTQIYIIHITEIHHNDQLITLPSLTFPIIIECDTNLSFTD